VLLEPNWILDFANASTTRNGISSQNGELHTNGDLPPSNLRPILGSHPSTIIENDRITPRSHWQDVRHLKFSVPGSHPYTPGATLTLYPKNFPVDVDEFIANQNWKSVADKPLHFVPSSPNVSQASSLPVRNLQPENTTTLRKLLTNHLDILSIPRRSFFAQLAHYTNDEFHRERLLEFTDPQYIDELYDYTTRPRRSILEVLQEFESVKIPWQKVCSLIPSMRGRQFSIASACAERDGNTEIELLVAIVKYKTVIKRIREGVCTRYITSLAPGTQLSVTLQPGGLNVTQKETDRPVVMIGPGTGVAPMRALIYQRIQWRKELALTASCKDLLFFGCRNADSDYFFKDEWTTLTSSNAPLEVFAAFSRDQVSPLPFPSSPILTSTPTPTNGPRSAKRSTSKTSSGSKAPRYTTRSRTRTASCIFAARAGKCRRLYARR
jgi:sulfite reductase alpha subunit-like flavoprotein